MNLRIQIQEMGVDRGRILQLGVQAITHDRNLPAAHIETTQVAERIDLRQARGERNA